MSSIFICTAVFTVVFLLSELKRKLLKNVTESRKQTLNDDIKKGERKP